MTNKKMNNVEILLSKLDKGKLSDFIRKECINDSRFQDRFLALGAGFFKPALTATLRVTKFLLTRAIAASPRMSQKKESITFVILSFAWCHQES